MNLSDQQAYFAAVKSDLKVFMQQGFHGIYATQKFLNNWHIDATVDCLEQAIQGKMPRLIINLPPRSLKSFIASVVLPAFILGRDPTAKIICISYSDDLAKTLSRDFRRVVESEWYRMIFPDVKLSKMTESEIVTDAGGFRYATSVGGTLTGRGADFIIIDDPIKPEDAHSDKARQGVNEWYRSTVLSRLDDKQRSVLIVVMQRLHVNDLTGYIEAGGGFHKLSFPAIAVKDEIIPVRNGDQHRRYEGDPLHPEYESLDVLKRLRDDLGAFHFASQYQQTPQTPDGGFFKREYFNLIDQAPRIDPDGALYLSIDSAISTSETADYSAFSLVYAYGRQYYVLSAERGRWTYETLLAKTLQYVRRYGRPDRPLHLLIEAAGTGVSLITHLKGIPNPNLYCFHYQPTKDKMHRAAIALPILAEGRVHVVNSPGNNAWVEPFINELVNFPHGRFDDWVDSLSQLLPFADRRGNRGRGFYEIY